MTQRTYNQYCPIAHSLDLIGDRWALLIIRDLLLGPKRFRDLAEGLPGLGTNILSDRLKQLEAGGVLHKRVLPAPAGVTVYDLTAYGRELEGPLGALAQWGGRTLGTPQSGQVISRDSLRLTARAWGRQFMAERGIASLAITIADPRLSDRMLLKHVGTTIDFATDDDAAAAMQISLTIDTLFGLASGAITLEEAQRAGQHV